MGGPVEHNHRHVHGPVNGSIILISLPAIFNGININPLTSFQYLLWMLMGYGVVTATLLLSFGRLSDMYGRVRLYNIGFAIFTLGSLLLFLTPDKGDAGAIEMIVFRLIQAVGAAFIFSNSAAILTDAFPPDERGKALGLNMVAALSGQFIGLLIGGILAVYNWRYVFLISVPFGVIGTIWAFHEAEGAHVPEKGPEDRSLGQPHLHRRADHLPDRDHLCALPVRERFDGLGEPARDRVHRS